MSRKGRQKKKSTIFKIFLIPLILIMLVQSGVTIGTMVVRRTAETLEEYSGGMMSRIVENRRVVLQNDMNQRWAAVREQEAPLNGIVQQFLGEEGVGLEEALGSDPQKERLLERLFPQCLDILRDSSTTGIFLLLTGAGMEEAGDFDGFFVRDSDPEARPANNSDLLLERGNKQISRTWDIPLDTNWTTRFHMEGLGRNPAERYFYEPWRAGTEYENADTADLGYWALPFTLEKDGPDPYEMIAYSLPLRYEGQVYGVLGVEISCKRLYSYFPVTELNGSQQSGYMLAVKNEDGGYTPLTGKGQLYSLVRAREDGFALQETRYENLSRVQDVWLNRQGVYAVVCPLRLYSNNVPYEDTQWVLMGLNTEKDLFGISRQLYFWMIVAVLSGLAFGVFGIYFLVRHLTRPVQQLMQCISKGVPGLREFKPSNILEVDALFEVVRDLTQRQKEAENILLEEKERYKLALESSKDIFFSYDLQSQELDLVNHPTMSGKWQCPRTENGLINPEYIYEEDQEGAIEALQQNTDAPYAEFRMRWPGEPEFTWVALAGKVIHNTDGQRWRMVGSIRNIQEQKEREAEQLRENTTDGVTGLYVYSAGMEELARHRRNCPKGVVVCLVLERLREINEKNGIVFGDLILEGIGRRIREQCRAYTGQSGARTVALRLNGDEFVLWLEGSNRNTAAEFTKGLLDKIAADFHEESLQVCLCAGLAHGEKEQSGEELVRRAKLARSLASTFSQRQVFFYESALPGGRASLPPLQGQDISNLGYDKDTSLVSVALNLFGKGADFPSQMLLMLQKIGRSYQADGVRVTLLRADFHSNYLNYQWSRSGERAAETVRKYREKERAAFSNWLGREEVQYFSREDSLRGEVQCFLSVEPGQQGILLPMYDSGNYMGNLCILGPGPELLDSPEEYQNLAELGRAFQSQLNQQQHDIASRAKSEFLSRMSHEIRTPMNGIIGMTEIALQPGQSPERVMDCLQKIQTSSDYLLGLINDILDMSKIESGKMQLEPANFSMDEMLHTVQELTASQAAAKQIDFSRDIRLQHHWFVADRMRISQVLLNLLGNAVKFTPARGKVALTVTESEGAEGPLVTFSVRDTGMGIAKEDQDRVFRSFEQAYAADPSKQQGTGLGLSISSRLVQLMGSSIRLESEPGEGSTFSFTVPLALGEDEGDEPEQEAISFEGRRILVVEDNELNAEIARCLLEECGFEVDCVSNGALAVERVRATAPGTYDVILMDIMMPVMDGLEATRTIRGMEREDCRTIPIIAMSANAFDDDLKKSVECGMNGHLSKPVQIDKLYRTLDKVIREQE